MFDEIEIAIVARPYLFDQFWFGFIAPRACVFSKYLSHRQERGSLVHIDHDLMDLIPGVTLAKLEQSSPQREPAFPVR